VESLIVLTVKLGGDPVPAVKELLRALGTEVILFTEDHSYFALTAYLNYGSGRHLAALNFGDCISYAVAAVAGEPLLYLGGDFAQTDVKRA
jgi:ribonuclease VapC